jgi:glycoside/pentoside/hexuronide:cation symporter, GPH family
LNRSVSTLRFSEKFSFGFGQLGEGLWNGAISIFVLFYYNQVLGVPASLVGLALAIALLFDAVTDPMAGSLSDNWKSRLGRRHPFMYASALPLALTFVLLFSPPAILGSAGLFVWLLVCSVLTRTAMTLYHVPHLALGAEMSDDVGERAVLVSFRQFFGTMGSLAAWSIGFGIFFAASTEFPNGQLNPAAYTPYAATLCVVIAISILWSAWGTRGSIPRLQPSTAPREPIAIVGSVTRMFREIVQSLANRSFRWLFAGVLIIVVVVGVDAALALYMTTYFWRISSGELTLYFIALPIGIMCGALITRFLVRQFEKRHLLIFGTCWWAFCQLTPACLALLGAFPESGTTGLVVTLVAFRFAQGVGVAQSLISYGAMIADVADEQELATGRRTEGILFGSLSFSTKAASALGSLIAGVGLDLIGWQSLPVDAIPAELVQRLAILYGPGVALFAVGSVWCFARIRMNRAQQLEISHALARRRGEVRTPN